MTTATKVDLGFSVLRPLAVARAGTHIEVSGPKRRALLAMLVANHGRALSRDAILDGVWGSDDPEAHRGSFHTYLSNLRALLGDVIERRGDGYRLVVPGQSIDVVAFEDAVDGARRLVTVDPGAAADQLQSALGKWRGRPYADLVDVPGLQDEIRRLEELRLSAVEVRIEADLAAGRHAELVAEIEALAEEHPTRERFRAHHMLALYRAGRQADALRAYRRTEEYLAEELGLEPSRQLRDLELAILQQDDDLLFGPGRTLTERLAFLVSDIEESTRAWERHRQGMADALATHDRILERSIESSGGRLFKHLGDGMLAAFPDAVSAVEAAESAQRELASASWGEVGELRVRMGIDVGEAESRGGDFYGPPLNRAARLCGAGHGGQVLVSAAAHAEITDSGLAGVQVRQLGQHRLRGLAAPERIAQLVFVGLPADFPELRIDDEVSFEGRQSGPALPGYEIRGLLGEGAFGIVYRSYQPSVGREVAIKVIRPELSSHPAFIRRFEAEARTIARLAHPHIIPLIDYWRDGDGAYLVLQLLPGGSLRDVLLEGGVAPATARRWLRHIAEALDHAHAADVVHGDLQPGNVLLDTSGNAYLSDFAIAARLIAPEIAASVSGSQEFLAPEVRDQGPSARADIFALGRLARELLGASDEIDEVIARATALDPTERHGSAAELLLDLERAAGEERPHVERPVVTRNPYKGLRAFDESDAADFYGRDELVAALVAAVERHRFVAVVGPSGSGKSSAVRAGLLPALDRGAVPGSESWLSVVLTPGRAPLDSLGEALEELAPRSLDLAWWLEAGDLGGLVERLLAGMDGDLLLVVDQFEELFTLVDDPLRREAFLELLVGAVAGSDSRVRVVATLRADFYDRPLEHAQIDRLVRDGLVTVLRPSHEELIEMITAPGRAAGLGYQPGLPHRIAAEVEDQPGGLPLLQFSLAEMVDRRRGGVITEGDYESIGGVSGALAGRAEAVFEGLTGDQQRAARQVFLRLVTVDEEADDTRRRVRRSELESLELDRGDLDAVLAAFTDQRLLLADRDPVTRGPTVEVAHEALLRRWPPSEVDRRSEGGADPGTAVPSRHGRLAGCRARRRLPGERCPAGLVQDMGGHILVERRRAGVLREERRDRCRPTCSPAAAADGGDRRVRRGGRCHGRSGSRRTGQPGRGDRPAQRCDRQRGAGRGRGRPRRAGGRPGRGRGAERPSSRTGGLLARIGGFGDERRGGRP